MFMKQINMIIIIAMVAMVISACDYVEPSKREVQGELHSFNSEEEFQQFLSDHEGRSYFYADTLRSTSTTLDGAFHAVDMVHESAAIPSQPGSVDFSETNVQVEGIDEMDIIKTDGEYIYTATNTNLFIIKARPADEAKIVTTKNLKNHITGLFIQDDVLAVAGSIRDFDELKELGFSSRTPVTFLDLYDVSDRENIELIKEYRFDGSYFNARLYDGIIYLSTSFNPYNRPSPMPIIIMDGVTRTMPVQDIYVYDRDYNSPSFVSIHSVDMASQENIDSKMVTLERGNHMYMSYENIYLTFSELTDRYNLQTQLMIEEIKPRLPASDKEFIARVNDVDDDILSKQEKQAKKFEVITRYVYAMSYEEQQKLEEEITKKVKDKLTELKYLEHTVIHKISVDKGKLSFQAANKVPGRVYGQFALDEYEGVLRVATTISQGRMITEEHPGDTWQTRSPSVNNVYTLDEDMNIIGELEGLAPTESIYSARYVGDRLYMVTFRQIDPFFVIDLSDPENPVDLGELKITGYSRYLHPYDEDTVIGLGREGTETGIIQGIKISLFDVSDVSNPQELITYVSDDVRSTSGAEWEHKAFLFSKERELLVIPARNHDFRNPENNYAGAIAFKINKEEITPRGIITHMSGGQTHGFEVERSLYIEDQLYTKSPNLLRINNIETLESTKNITLSATAQGNIPIY